jgi:hypothetical protein
MTWSWLYVWLNSVTPEGYYSKFDHAPTLCHIPLTLKNMNFISYINYISTLMCVPFIDDTKNEFYSLKWTRSMQAIRRGATINRGAVYCSNSIPQFHFRYTILHRGTMLLIWILENHVNWLENHVVKMASDSVKRSVQWPTNLQNDMTIVFGAVNEKQ